MSIHVQPSQEAVISTLISRSENLACLMHSAATGSSEISKMQVAFCTQELMANFVMMRNAMDQLLFTLDGNSMVTEAEVLRNIANSYIA